ncbi:MAG: SDR family oxidoreductase [Bacteroidota bacterium]
MSLAQQVAIVTGASSGIGRAIAKDLAKEGVKILATGRRQSRLEELAEEVPGLAFMAGDISEPALPAKLMRHAVDTFGSCDIVVNNAGVMHTGSIEKVNIEVLCQMIRINVEGATRMAYTALKHFKEKGQGHLVNISSILGTKVRPTAGVYAGTKYSIEALSEALRMEVSGTDIKVSVIEPGLVDSELQNHFEVHPKEMLGIKDALAPEDISRCLKFILEQPPHVRIPVMMVLPNEQGL